MSSAGAITFNPGGPNGTPTATLPWTDNNITDAAASASDVPTDRTVVVVIGPAERVVETLLLSLICVVAFSGNVLLWCVVVRNKTLRTPSNALVLCLSSADILVALVNMPITIVTILSGGWVFSDWLCVLLGFTNMTFFIGSVVSLAAISLNRYVLIVHPKRFKTIYTVRNTGFVILGVWLLSMFLASPPLIGWARYDFLPGQSFCFCHWETSISYTFFMVIVCFGGPCSVMSFCYYNILREVRRSRKRLAAGPPGSDAHSAPSATSNNNSSGGNRGDENGSSGQGGRCREGGPNMGGERDTLGQVKKSRMTSLHETLTRQFSRKRVRVEPISAENCLPGRAIGEDRPKSLPTRIPSIQIKCDPPSSQTNASPGRTGSRYQSQNQSPSTSRPAKIRLLEFQRSVSLDSRRKSNTQLVRELHDKIEEGVVKTVNNSPQRQGTASRQLSGSTLAVPGLKSVVGARKKRAKTEREMRRKREELKLTKSFLVVILVFFCCWFPFCITMFWSVFSPYPVYRAADITSLILGFFNSCCNPVIYGVMNTRFRAGFKHILCCHWTPCCRSKTGKGWTDRGFGSVTGTAVGGTYNDDVSCTAD